MAIVKELFIHAIKRLGFLIIILAAPLACAKDFGDWTYYAYGNKYSKHCLIYTESHRVKGNYEEPKIPYLYIIKRGHREFSLGVALGGEQDVNKPVILEVNNRAYALKMVLPEYSWTFSSIQDVGLIDEMLKASSFVTVRTYGPDGVEALDYYSLKGFLGALKQLNNCHAKHYAKDYRP